MHYWYKFFTYIFYPISPIYLFLRKLKKKEHSTRYREKFSQIRIIIDRDLKININSYIVGNSKKSNTIL